MRRKPTSYPRKVRHENGLELEISLVDVERVPLLIDMLRQLPSKDQARLQCDVKDPDYPTLVRRQIEEKSVHRLIATNNDGKIVGSLALYPGATRWYRHTGKFIQVTHPDFRRQGIATMLLDEVLNLAEEFGVEKVFCELTDLHKNAIKMVKELGFQREAVLHDHMRDDEGNRHKLYIYSMQVETAAHMLEERMFGYVRLD